MTEQHQRPAALHRHAHAQGAELEYLQRGLAHRGMRLGHAKPATNAGNRAAAAPALTPLSLSSAIRGPSSGVTPQAITAWPLRRQFISQALSTGCWRQRIVLLRVTAHMRSQSAGSAGLGTTWQRRFFSSSLPPRTSTRAINAALNRG